MDPCGVCSNKEFYLADGHYFCFECNTQQEKREEVNVYVFDPSVRAKKKRIKKPQIVNKNEIELSDILAITNVDIKITVLQLWATYLGKIQVAFMSRKTSKKELPKLSRNYKKKDCQIIYKYEGKKGRKRKRSHSVASSKSCGSSLTSSEATGINFTDRVRQLKRDKKAFYLNEYEKRSDSGTDITSITNITLSSYHSNASKLKKKDKINLYRRFNKISIEREKKNNEKIKTIKSKKIKSDKIDKLILKSQNIAEPDCLGLTKLWGILYIALRIHDSDIHLSDLLRLHNEGHLKYKQLHNKNEQEPEKKITNNTELSYQSLIDTSSKLIKFLGVSQIPSPNLITLIKRYCIELQLPNGIGIYAERILSKSPPIFTVKKKTMYTTFPNYEAKAMAIIITILKILFGLDGVTEIEMSRVVDKINTAAEERGNNDRLFNFCEWQRYIECRKTIIMSQHYPTKFRYYPKTPTENSDLYVNYLKEFKPIDENTKLNDDLDDNDDYNDGYDHNDTQNYNNTIFKNKINRDLAQTIDQMTNAMKDEVNRLIEQSPIINDNIKFDFSLTPLYSYLEKLKNNTDIDIPGFLRLDLTSSKIGYITNPDMFKEHAADNGFDLIIVKSSANYVEKIVPTWDGCTGNLLIKTPEIFNKDVPVVLSTIEENNEIIINSLKNDDHLTYFHSKNYGKLYIDKRKQKVYRNMCKADEKKLSRKKIEKNAIDDFGFGLVKPNGDLYVPDGDSDSSDSSDNDDSNDNDDKNEKILLSKFERLNIDGTICKLYTNNKLDKSSKVSYERNKLCDCLMCENCSDEDDEIVDDNIDKQNEIIDDHDENQNDNEVIDDYSENQHEIVDDNNENQHEIIDNNNEIINIEKDNEIIHIDDENDKEIIDIDDENDDDEIIPIDVDDNHSDSEQEILILSESINDKNKLKQEIMFIPYKDFWLRRVSDWRLMTNPKFTDIKLDLPFNYRWLLTECSKIINIDEKLLFHEICRVESYFADVLSVDVGDGPKNNNKNKSTKFDQSTDYNRASIKKLWLN
ncbi:hypothetical protein HCN44_004672 [Aphidius gifuensis]|uniref:TATA box-binding protein-associated factor RNA polymerase I subunit B n=1 Tax=Aphidius gifuensis TaxID=684658 RepID=A0A834Y020_APHGI|nr:hypothetical protein HCN44_004672 [Aphidius gifuensis]